LQQVVHGSISNLSGTGNAEGGSPIEPGAYGEFVENFDRESWAIFDNGTRIRIQRRKLANRQPWMELKALEGVS
jgi:hypothetical protein